MRKFLKIVGIAFAILLGCILLFVVFILWKPVNRNFSETKGVIRDKVGNSVGNVEVFVGFTCLGGSFFADSLTLSTIDYHSVFTNSEGEFLVEGFDGGIQFGGSSNCSKRFKAKQNDQWLCVTGIDDDLKTYSDNALWGGKGLDCDKIYAPILSMDFSRHDPSAPRTRESVTLKVSDSFKEE